MYDIIQNIIGHAWETSNYSTTEQQLLYYVCGSLIIILTVTFIDVLYRVFRHFWR